MPDWAAIAIMTVMVMLMVIVIMIVIVVVRADPRTSCLVDQEISSAPMAYLPIVL